MPLMQETIGTQALPTWPPVIVQQPMGVRRAVPYSPMGHTAYHHLGGVVDDAGNLGHMAAVAFAAYHGYQRNKGDVPWTLVWALCAYTSPLVTVAWALAQRTVLKKGR